MLLQFRLNAESLYGQVVLLFSHGLPQIYLFVGGLLIRQDGLFLQTLVIKILAV